MRSVDVKMVPVASLVADPENVRIHGKANLRAIQRSMARFGQLAPLVLAADGRTVLAGNGRLVAAQALGWTEVACIMSDLSGRRARAFAIADNRTGELSSWDVGGRERMLDDLADEPELQADAWAEADEALPPRKQRAASSAKAEPDPPTRAQVIVSCRSEDRAMVAAVVSAALLDVAEAVVQ